jgi:cytochrome d ubiquinol oxidase subunit II
MAEPFPLFCSIALITGYCLMGAGWLNWRCTGSLEYRARRAIPWLSALTLVLVTGLLVWTIFFMRPGGSISSTPGCGGRC